MQWWLWVLIAIGAIVLGAVKLTLFNRIMNRKTVKNKFTDED